MNYDIRYTDEALQVLEKYKKSNPIAYKKAMRLLDEITEHPREGSGHPEPLTGGNKIKYSRHISGKDRIIYNVYDDIVVVLIVSVGGHYSDK
ncbi:MAG: type II toxin-antitoxin system YoeB family toxin [Clostridiales bacterium]|jgi:toxin YoeB|nr:type II toxin-antitoxin system YoeB family toxin [Clostridiales bacterium]